MLNTFIESPATPSGTNAEKLESMYRYLLRMSEQLNAAMNTITLEETGTVNRQQVKLTRGAEAAVTDPDAEASEKIYNSMKSMIVKTAKIIRSEMDEISTQLHGEYEAISDEFGTLTDTLDTTIKATAEGVVQEYNRTERITQRLGENETNLENYMRKLSQYIFMGYIDADHVGIAIGNNVTARDEHDNEILNDQNKMATFTMEELAFYVNGVKAAWYSGSTFYIARGQVTDSLQIGSNHVWRVVPTGNIALCAIPQLQQGV